MLAQVFEREGRTLSQGGQHALSRATEISLALTVPAAVALAVIA